MKPKSYHYETSTLREAKAPLQRHFSTFALWTDVGVFLYINIFFNF